MGWVHYARIMVCTNILVAVMAVMTVVTEGTTLPARVAPVDGSAGAMVVVFYVVANAALALRNFNNEG